MELLYTRPKTIIKPGSYYCPGCLHALAGKLIAEVIQEMGVQDDTLLIASVGCGGMFKRILDVDCASATHGRAAAAATGACRCAPEKLVFTYQGDGDLAAIGLAETLNAANRGENFVAILINNSTYGMTGGQMAPTTMIGQASTTTPGGRQAEREGYPMHMCEIIDQLTAPRFIARYSLDKPAEIRKAKAGIRHAFDIQRAHKGYSFVELMSNCPTNWGLSPLQSLEFMREKTLKEFPLGVFRDLEKEETL
ncbi:MAG: 2-oxoglutarate oxidoreductase [Firmicutes bacterium]|nr:2-oxoglutarate oxidoreductase [Bacillota bacterium]